MNQWTRITNYHLIGSIMGTAIVLLLSGVLGPVVAVAYVWLNFIALLWLLLWRVMK